MLPRITVNQSIDPHLNPRACRPISDPINPVAIDLGNQDAHAESVSYELQRLKDFTGDSMRPNDVVQLQEPAGEARR
jgi:hypothetical protein